MNIYNQFFFVSHFELFFLVLDSLKFHHQGLVLGLSFGTPSSIGFTPNEMRTVVSIYLYSIIIGVNRVISCDYLFPYLDLLYPI